MKTIQKLTALFILLTAITSLHAGDKIRIILHQPPPNKMGVGDMWNLELYNTTNKEIKIYLTGTATEEKDGLIIGGKTRPFSVNPGSTNYKFNDFSGTEINYNNSKYKEIILRTGNAPEGSYTICVTAFDESGTEVGRENCITQTVQQLGSITLLTPGEGEEVDPNQPFMFSWTPLPGAKEYTLRIVELKGDQSPEVAMRTNQPIFEKELKTTSFQGDPIHGVDIKLGMKLAWQVTSGDVQSEVGLIGRIKGDMDLVVTHKHIIHDVDGNWYFSVKRNELTKMLNSSENTTKSLEKRYGKENCWAQYQSCLEQSTSGYMDGECWIAFDQCRRRGTNWTLDVNRLSEWLDVTKWGLNGDTLRDIKVKIPLELAGIKRDTVREIKVVIIPFVEGLSFEFSINNVLADPLTQIFRRFNNRKYPGNQICANHHVRFEYTGIQGSTDGFQYKDFNLFAYNSMPANTPSSPYYIKLEFENLTTEDVIRSVTLTTYAVNNLVSFNHGHGFYPNNSSGPCLPFGMTNYENIAKLRFLMINESYQPINSIPPFKIAFYTKDQTLICKTDWISM